MNLSKNSNTFSALEKSDVRGVAERTYNIFESAVPSARPTVNRLKEKMLQNGALSARMSGSGPSVYGLFDRAETAQKAAEIIQADGARAFVCKTL